MGTLLFICHGLPQHYLFLSWDLRIQFIGAESVSRIGWVGTWGPESIGWKEKRIYFHGEVTKAHSAFIHSLISFLLQSGDTGTFLCLYYTQGCDLLKVEAEVECRSLDSISWARVEEIRIG